MRKIILSAACIALAGCASIISDSTYPVNITSSPSAVKYKLVNSSGHVLQSGTTPSMVTLEAGEGYFKGARYTVEFESKNGQKISRDIVPGVDGWYVANILFGGIIGLLIVDPLTGAMYTLPETVNASFDDVAMNSDDVNLRIVSLDTLSAEQKEQLIALN